jgi:hypothetical protein
MQVKVLSKQCSCCKQHKELSYFHKNKNRSLGVHEYCKECRKQENPESAKRSALNYIANKDKLLVKMKEYYSLNKDRKQEYGRSHYKENKHKYVLNATQRKKHIKLATPAWLTDNEKWMIEEAYHLAKLRSNVTGFQWEVDHVIPLRGKLVCGLHTPYNLQVIPQTLNNTKRNKYEVV